MGYSNTGPTEQIVAKNVCVLKILRYRCKSLKLNYRFHIKRTKNFSRLRVSECILGPICFQHVSPIPTEIECFLFHIIISINK